MSTIAIHYPNTIRVRRFLAVGFVLILLMTSLILIGAATLTIMKSKPVDSIQADPIYVVEQLMPPVELQPVAPKTPIAASTAANEPSVIPVPTPLLAEK